MLEALKAKPADPILAISQAYKNDPNPQKIDLGVGVYRDDDQTCPLFKSIERAQKAIAEDAKSKQYVSIKGNARFLSLVQDLVFGELSRPVMSVQSIGGTGALRLIGDTLAEAGFSGRIFIPSPGWPNHQALFKASGLNIATYDYKGALPKEEFKAHLLQTLNGFPPNSAFVLHACCHNPSGFDIPAEIVDDIVKIAQEKGHFVILDMAYLGFAQGIEEDKYLVKAFQNADVEFALSFSASKSFGLYSERVGAAFMFPKVGAPSDSVSSAVLSLARAAYSMPPDFGSQLVERVLESPELRQIWEAELSEARERLQRLRRDLSSEFQRLGFDQGFMHAMTGNGLFALLPITEQTAIKLREEFSIYCTNSGRINISGLRYEEVGRFAECIQKAAT